MPDVGNPIMWIKFCQLVVGLVCAGLIGDRVPTADYQKTETVHAGYYGGVMVSGICFLSFCLDEQIDKKTNICATIVGMVMYTAAAALIIEFWNNAPSIGKTKFTGGDEDNSNILLAAGILGLIVAALYVVDFVMTVIKVAG